jgi:tartrate-resistant acid phosphatase type 5
MILAAVALTLQIRGDTLRIAVVGDIGAGTKEIALGIAAVHRAAPLDAIVTTGDNIYPCGVRSASDPQWDLLRPLASLGVPIYPVLGNHDRCGNAAAEIGAPLPNWRFPSTEYVVQTAAADFAMLDTTAYAEGRAPPPDIGALFSGSTTAWRIAVGHHPLLSSGYHGHFPRGEHHRMLRLIAAMRQAHVDLYMSGHDHHLELIRDRPLMLISGAGSEPIPPVLRHAQTLWANEGPAVRGFAVVEITPQLLSIRFFDWRGAARSPRFDFRALKNK